MKQYFPIDTVDAVTELNNNLSNKVILNKVKFTR